VVEALDFDTIFADAVTRMKAEMPEFKARESDPSTKNLLVLSYVAQILRQRVNDAARAVMPAFSTGADLDNLAAVFGVGRYTLSEADTTTGAAAVMESDTDFRRRMVLAPEGYSVAGAEGSYIFHALSADAQVLDASATGPKPDDIKALALSVLAQQGAESALVTAMMTALNTAIWPGQVDVAILARADDGTASPDLVATVDTYLSAETRRPLTDYVVVKSAQIVSYDVIAALTLFAGPDAGVVLAAARTNLEAYVAACHRIGRDVTLSGIYAALHVEGVQKVDLLSPAADIAITRSQAPWCSGITLTIAGNGE
jgi:phage-related baseplate assembly protein